MRIFHTSDWHLGRLTGGVSRRPDQVAVLQEVLENAKDFRPHLILHSGDLFETSRPAIDDMQLAQEVLHRMSELAPTVVIAGNHDSAALFELFEALVGRASRLKFIGRPLSPGQGGILEFPGESGEVARLACMPFIHANRVVDAMEQGPELRTMAYADRIKKIQQSYAKALEKGYHPDRHILLFCAHLYVEGAIFGRSERQLHVSDTYATRTTHIPEGVSYAAFGHIHKPQPLPGGAPGRYAGSTLQLDFGEEGEVKQVVRVEARPGRAARITPVELHSGRRLLSLRGSQESLAERAEAVGDALIKLVVETDEPTEGLSDWAAKTFSKATVLEVHERCHRTRTLLVDELPEAEARFEDLETAFAAYLSEALPEDQSLETVMDTFKRVSGEHLDPEVDNAPDILLKLEALLK